MNAPPRRLIYNYDAWGPFLWVHQPEDLRKNLDLFAGSQVTTVMLSPSLGQSTVYPSEVSEMCHWREQSPAARREFHHEMGTMYAAATERVAAWWRTQRLDLFGQLVQAVTDGGREAIASMRMNDVHCLRAEDRRGPYTNRFYRQHPECRLPSGGLDYGRSEVRAHRLALFEEVLRKYPFAGLDLDFVRGPQFFRTDYPGQPSVPYGFPEEMAEGSVPLMTEFVGEVRKMVDRVSRETGRPLGLSVRVPSTLSGCRRIGLDPVEWHRRKYLDFLTVSRFLQLRYELPIAEYKAALPGLTIYSALDYIINGRGAHGQYIWPRDGIAEAYRGAAAAHYAQGSDGLYVFNMYVPRGNGRDPSGKDWSHPEPAEVLKEIGDPQTLVDKTKLYLVDAAYPLFDLRFFDAPSPLPAEAGPTSPLLVPMIVAERELAQRRCVLRLVTKSPAAGICLILQVNGRRQGVATAAERPRLFSEPYDQNPPDPGCSFDFSANGADFIYGRNEIAVLASAPITVVGLELAVTG